jgi:isochorismate synthase
MAEILKYRFPDKEIVEQTGFFREVESSKDLSGFVISTFLKDKYYQFSPLETAKSTYFYEIEKPYIVTKNEYLNEANSFLDAFERLKIKKAVFSRVKVVEFDQTKTEKLFKRLCELYPKAFVYLVSSELFGTWIGATPEILLLAISGSGFTISLAGTQPVTNGKEWTEKEKVEQGLVTEFLDDQLKSIGILEIEKNGPYDLEAGPVKHLRTDFSFDLGKLKPIEIAKHIHPTPAVSGLPQKPAIDLINFREPHDRLLYTGIIGIVTDEKSSLYVNLRCCQIQKGQLFLYLGGGFTPDSIPESEWEETENKAKTLLRAIESI